MMASTKQLPCELCVCETRHRLDQRIAFQKLSCFCLPPVVLTLERKKLVQRAPQTLLPLSLWVQTPAALAFEADL